MLYLEKKKIVKFFKIYIKFMLYSVISLHILYLDIIFIIVKKKGRNYICKVKLLLRDVNPTIAQ